jgi:predicted O-methyltransferase YrrM
MPSFGKTLIWYLRQPYLYPDLFRLAGLKIRRTFLGSDGTTEIRARAVEWCNQRAVVTGQALRQITGSDQQISVTEKFPHVFAQSKINADACPIKMGGPGNLDLLYQLAEFTQARRVIETGVAYGWSSLAILLSLQPRDGLLVSTDLPYPGLDNDPYVGCVVPDNLKTNWKLLRAADRRAIPKALKLTGSIDLCHYDSDKSYVGRMWTYPKLWQALRPGGIFISDDIGDNLGFSDFTRSIAVEPVVVRCDEKFVGVLLKTT